MKRYIFKNKKSNIFRKIISSLGLILSLLLYGCNTMEGAGTDIQEVGKSLEKAADRNKPDAPPCPCCHRP